MPSPSADNPFTRPLKDDPEHMMKLLIALSRALDINPASSTHKNADALASRRR